MTSSVVGQRRSKVLPKTKFAPKKTVMVTVWRSAAHLTHYSFLNPGETITSEKYAQQNWWDALKTTMPTTSTSQQKGPNSPWQHLITHGTTNASKLNELGYEGLSHLPYSPDLSPTDYHFFKHLDNLLQGKCFHNQHDIENAFKEFIEYRSMDFYDTGKNKFIPCWQKCIDCNGS